MKLLYWRESKAKLVKNQHWIDIKATFLLRYFDKLLTGKALTLVPILTPHSTNPLRSSVLSTEKD